MSLDALKLLKSILPYLIIKKKQAQLLIEFQEKMKDRNAPKRDTFRKLKQEAYFYEIRKLNFKNRLHLQRLSEETPEGEATV